MTEWACVNGNLLPADEAHVSIFDAALMQGVGLFETLRAYRGRLFRLEQHLDRLAQSARDLGWAQLPDADELSDQVRRLLAQTPGQDARVRVTVSSGSLRATRNDAAQLTTFITASPGGSYQPEYYKTGVGATVSRWWHNPRDPTAGHKTTSYFARLAGLRDAHAAGAFETLWFTPDGALAEGSISSVFLVQAGALRTPPLDIPILPGITRAAVIEEAARLEIPVHEARLTIEDVRGADELFVANSMMEVMPIARLDTARIGIGAPGEITSRLAAAYAALVARECGLGQEDAR